MKIFVNMPKKKSRILSLFVIKSLPVGNIWIESGREILETGSK
jgi:hypothetical protein